MHVMCCVTCAWCVCAKDFWSTRCESDWLFAYKCFIIGYGRRKQGGHVLGIMWLHVSWLHHIGSYVCASRVCGVCSMHPPPMHMFVHMSPFPSFRCSIPFFLLDVCFLGFVQFHISMISAGLICATSAVALAIMLLHTFPVWAKAATPISSLLDRHVLALNEHLNKQPLPKTVPQHQDEDDTTVRATDHERHAHSSPHHDHDMDATDAHHDGGVYALHADDMRDTDSKISTVAYQATPHTPSRQTSIIFTPV